MGFVIVLVVQAGALVVQGVQVATEVALATVLGARGASIPVMRLVIEVVMAIVKLVVKVALATALVVVVPVPQM